MPDLRALADTLERLDGRGYRDYKQIAGEYDAGTFRRANRWSDTVEA